MTIEQILQNITLLFQNQDLILKTVLILLMTLFLLFTIVLGRQVSLLTNVINQVTFSPVFKLVAYGLSVATLVLLVLVIIV